VATKEQVNGTHQLNALLDSAAVCV